MNTLEINLSANSNPFLKKFYSGCFAADLLPTRKIPKENLPTAFVVNICDSSRSDDLCHWIGIWIGKENTEFFDSGGGDDSYRSNEHIKRFVDLQKKTVVFNSQQIQSYTSDRCGKFVLCFLHAKAIDLKLSLFLSVFHKTNLEKNDVIIDALFKFIFLRKRKSLRK